MMGRNTRATNTSGVASSSTARSGAENAMFFGTSSPNTTCRNVTMTSVITNPIPPMTSSGSPVRPSGASSRWWMAGSDTSRISSEAAVMPSCVVESMSVACSIAPSAVRAERRPSSASGSTCERRAEMTANSAATKNALTASSSTSQTSPAQSFTAPPSRDGRGLDLDGRIRAEAQPVDPPAVEAQHLERALLGADAVAHLRQPAELADDEAGDGLVQAALGHAHAGLVAQLVGPQDAREGQRVAAAHDAGAGAVVLVDEVADELLHEVLERGDAGGAAVLVDHDGHLVAAAAQLAEQRVEGDRLRHAERLRSRCAPTGTSARRSRGTAIGLLHVHEPDDVVDAVLAGDREAGEAGAARELEHVGGGGGRAG